tara:strand:- start:3655 stop:4095 length:441 start_codon:yes stop_codon:yes gene_type:complete
MPTEPVPVTDVLSELDTNWNASNVGKPVLVEMAGTDAVTRLDLNRGDYLIARPGTPTLDEIPIGNWKYINRTYNVIVEIQTRNSRQRLYDLMAEVRKICHVRRHSMTNFQRLQFLNFNEEVGEQVNVWLGTIELQTVNENVVAETS